MTAGQPDFQREYMGEWESPDKDLYNMAKLYHDNCEAYDQLVCMGRNERGVAIPATGEEFRLVAQYAQLQLKELVEQGPYGKNTLGKAISDYHIEHGTMVNSKARKTTYKADYDEMEDVLYVSFGKERPGVETEVYNGVFIREDPQTNEVVGFTIMDFKRINVGNSTAQNKKR